MSCPFKASKSVLLTSCIPIFEPLLPGASKKKCVAFLIVRYVKDVIGIPIGLTIGTPIEGLTIISTKASSRY